MLIDFEVGNFKSFREPIRLSLLAANPIKEHEEDTVFEAGPQRLLKCAAVYGANASGKSNLMDALVNMRWFALNSSKESQATEEIDVTPFKLDADFEGAPSRFEVRLLIEGVTYRYGYEVDSEAVRGEWLFRATKRAESELFLRREDQIEVFPSRFREGKGLEEKTRDNALFLSVVAQFNGTIAQSILTWFSEVRPLHGLHGGDFGGRSVDMLMDEGEKQRLLEFVRTADFGMESMTAKEEEFDESEILRLLTEEGRRRLRRSTEAKTVSISGVHAKYRGGERIGTANLDLATEESAGTSKFFFLAGPLLDCLREGRVAIVDELDARLHPHLTREIVRLFNSAETNPHNAQLLFCTHDTNLLTKNLFRRDQIWFVEKDKQGATALYSLADIKVRNDAAFERNYLRGRYGAVPILADFAEPVKGGG